MYEIWGPGQVAKQLNSIFDKTGASNRLEAIIFYKARQKAAALASSKEIENI